jgi:hypothetical protein
MDREPIGASRLPALGSCGAAISSSIGVDLPIPPKPPEALCRPSGTTFDTAYAERRAADHSASVAACTPHADHASLAKYCG